MCIRDRGRILWGATCLPHLGSAISEMGRDSYVDTKRGAAAKIFSVRISEQGSTNTVHTSYLCM